MGISRLVAREVGDTRFGPLLKAFGSAFSFCLGGLWNLGLLANCRLRRFIRGVCRPKGGCLIKGCVVRESLTIISGFRGWMAGLGYARF